MRDEGDKTDHRRLELISLPGGGDPAPEPVGNTPGRWLTLVPVEVFGLMCDDHEPPRPVAWGLCDAVSAWSDCNRADGHLYRVEDLQGIAREPGETVRVWVAEADVPFFLKRWGETHGQGEAESGMIPPAAPSYRIGLADNSIMARPLPAGRLLDGLLAGWFENNPGVRRAYTQDPTYHAQASLLIRVLVTVEAVTRDAGVDVATQLRVLQTVLAEVLDTDAALDRVATQERLAREMSRC